VKYAWIQAHRSEFDLRQMCEVLDVSVFGYRAWKRGGTQNRKRLTDAQLLALIRAIHAEVKRAYGSPRMRRELRRRGFAAGEERVARLMRENGIRARHKRRFKATTNSRHNLPVAPNLLERNFTPAAPNQVWTADMTYVWTDDGWLYLAVVLDLFNREVVGWSLKPRMTADIVCDALAMAWFRRKPAAGLIHHSMSRKGDCWDNAPTESFFNSLKNERVHGTRYAAREEAKADIFEYIEAFYNRKRLHSTLGYVAPHTYLQNWISSQHESELAA
jgi:putative transposase